ncbi:MAG TPA: GYF domain-containing protein [Polyangiaceae bacterium]|nr:GYF domain-containing protein [Polyangiaceae bacterium]
MTQSNNDIEELEELLTELEGQEARLVAPYSEDDDAVTQLMDAPLGDQEWMVQVTALDRRMMSTDQLVADLQAGKLSSKTLVWRGGMEDWLPIARVEGLAQAAGAPASSPAPRMNVLAAPAPLPAPPMWSTLPSAPLGPPPAALPPNLSAPPPTSSPSMGLGLPPVAASALPQRVSQTDLPRPVASLPPPPAVATSNTTRPVAVDFGDMMPEDTTSPLRGKRAVMALSAVAVLAVFISAYALSSKSEATASAEPAAQPRSVGALQPAPSEKKAEPSVPSKLPEPPPEAAAKPSESEVAANEPPASSAGARTTAPARYSPKAEYRRRSRGSAERATEAAEADSPSAAPAAEVPARATAAAEESAAPEVASAAAVDDADSAEAPKSTSKSSGTFNRESAKQALDDAASQARNCRPAGGPSGSGQVQVRYEPSGKVAAVQILTGKFENTTTGSCVKMLFRRAKVPEFTGAPVVVVVKKFEIP